MTSERTAARDPLWVIRWLDVALVIATAPVALLAGAPALGIAVGAAAWVIQRIGARAIENKASAADNPKTQAGLLLASTLGRAWLVGLSILAVGLAGAREDGLAAAVLVLAAFTLYFVLSLILRPLERSTARS